MQKSQATNEDDKSTIESDTTNASVVVIDADGMRGAFDSYELENSSDHGVSKKVAVQFGEHTVLVDSDVLVPDGPDTYRLPLRLKDLVLQASSGAGEAEYAVLPVIEEEMRVDKQIVETGRVRVTKRIHEHNDEINVPLTHKEVHIEHVPVNKFVDEAPPSRHEGDTLILPVMEEVLIVEKKLRIKEEVHITSRESEVVETVRTTLREEEISVDREDSN